LRLPIYSNTQKRKKNTMNGKILKLACKNIEQNNVTSASTDFSILLCNIQRNSIKWEIERIDITYSSQLTPNYN
jgi:hypothetical protein